MRVCLGRALGPCAIAEDSYVVYRPNNMSWYSMSHLGLRLEDHCDHMKPEAFGLREVGAGGNLPEEWQALIASQASTLAALLSRIQTTAATLRQQQAPAAQLQALAA